MIQVAPVKEKNYIYDNNIDIYAVKRKTAGTTESATGKNQGSNKIGKNVAEGSNNNKQTYPGGANEEQYTYSQPVVQGPTPQQQQSYMPVPMQKDVQPAVKKPRKKRQSKVREVVEISIERTWDKLRRTQVTMSVAEYLAMNKKTSRDVKEGLLYIHRRKPSTRKIAQTYPNRSSAVSNPVVINALRSGGLLDEVVYANSINTNNTSMGNMQNDSDSSEDEDEDSNSSSNYTSSSEITDSEYDDELDIDDDDDDSVQANYPYNRARMRSAQPVRVFISINNQLVEAVLDSDAAVSVCSIKLVKRLNLEIDHDEKIQ